MSCIISSEEVTYCLSWVMPRVKDPHFLADPDPGKNLLEDPDPDPDPVILIMIPKV